MAGPEAPGVACDFLAGAFEEAFETLFNDRQLRTERGSRTRKLACEEMGWQDRSTMEGA